jgi:hypothetical protein
VLPTLVRLVRRTLERGRRNPRKGDGRLFRARPGQHRDIRPVRRVSSVTIGPVWQSLPPRRHPGHCSAIPDAVGVRGDKTPPRRLLCTLRPPVIRTLESAYGRQLNKKLLHHHPQSCSWADTGHVTTPCQKQDSPGRPSPLRHCAPYCYTQLAQRGTLVNYLPLAYKRRGQSPCRGGTTASTHHDIGTLPQSKTSGTWRPCLLSRLACSSPLQAPRCNAI